MPSKREILWCFYVIESGNRVDMASSVSAGLICNLKSGFLLRNRNKENRNSGYQADDSLSSAVSTIRSRLLSLEKDNRIVLKQQTAPAICRCGHLFLQVTPYSTTLIHLNNVIRPRVFFGPLPATQSRQPHLQLFRRRPLDSLHHLASHYGQNHFVHNVRHYIIRIIVNAIDQIRGQRASLSNSARHQNSYRTDAACYQR